MSEEVKKFFDVREVHFGFTTILTVLGSVIWLTWVVSSEREKINIRLDSLEQIVQERTDDRWRRQDMKYFCTAFEALNDEFNLKCPNI